MNIWLIPVTPCTGVWIEISFAGLTTYCAAMSLLAQECGLKLFDHLACAIISLSLLAQECGLK